jgi:pimeloyl-ACP methyl ester carboxylesterase
VRAGFRVLIPSRPGYGQTPLQVGQSAAQAAEALVALLDCLQVQTCAVLAISGGGPTGVALASMFPERVTRLVLLAAITRPEERQNEPAYKDQMAFYGPMHNLTWGMLDMMSRLSPRAMARQTLAIFSTHNPDEALSRLKIGDIESICRFYQGRSSRFGALNDAIHTIGKRLLNTVHQPTLVVHSRKDKSVPFAHAEWSLKHIPQAELCEAGFTGHFVWIVPDFPRISQRMIAFLSVN